MTATGDTGSAGKAPVIAGAPTTSPASAPHAAPDLGQRSAQPDPKATPAPAANPAADPALNPAPQPAAKPAPQPAEQRASQPAPQPAPHPEAQSTAQAAPRVKTHIPPPTAIRDTPPRARRLSRRILLAGAVLIGGVFAAALVIGLSDTKNRNRSASDPEITTSPAPPESVRAAPANYDSMSLAGEPELASPTDRLWGDHPPPPDPQPAFPPDAQYDAGSAPPLPPRDPALSEAARADAAARGSPILFGDRPGGTIQAAPTPTRGPHGAFLAAQGRSESVLDARLSAPASRYMIQAGATIPAALLTALNSDLPGRVIAQVSENVFDSQTGDHLLVPQGARLIGAYQSDVSYGERRILIAWNRLILPSGWSIELKGMEATDASGAAGARARTDNHLGRLALASVLSGALTVAANEVEDDTGGGLTPSVGDAAAQEAASVGGRIVDRELSVHPTLRVPAGAPIRVLVSRDIVLRPYRP